MRLELTALEQQARVLLSQYRLSQGLSTLTAEMGVLETFAALPTRALSLSRVTAVAVALSDMTIPEEHIARALAKMVRAKILRSRLVRNNAGDSFRVWEINFK